MRRAAVGRGRAAAPGFESRFQALLAAGYQPPRTHYALGRVAQAQFVRLTLETTALSKAPADLPWRKLPPRMARRP